MIMKESYNLNSSSITLSSNSRGFSQSKEIFEELLEGFDCESPEDVISHEFETVEKCEDDSALVKSNPAKMQILQRTTRYMNKGIKCLRSNRYTDSLWKGHLHIPRSRFRHAYNSI